MFLEDRKDIGETYQLLLDDLPLDQILFPDNKHLEILINRLADLWRDFAEERIPAPVIQHASKLNHILPALVQSGQYLTKHPQWHATLYATDYTTESVYFNFNAHEDRTGTERPGYIAYPLPKEGWMPESYLPDLLTSELDNQLSKYGFAVPSPIFLGFVPHTVADPVVQHSLFLDSDQIVDMIHGKNTHQLQVLSTLNAGVMDKDQLLAMIKADVWSELFDQDLYTDMRDQLLWLWNKYPWYSKKVNLFPTSYFHLTMRSPHSIHIPLLTGGFSRAIEQALAKGSRSESELKATLGLRDDQSLSQGIDAIRTLEDYTRYRHFQVLHDFYHELLATGGCISFREFIQDQYQHREILNLGLHRIRAFAMARSIRNSLKDADIEVFGIQGNDHKGVSVHQMNGTWSNDMNYNSFVVLKKAPGGGFNLKVLDTLKAMSRQQIIKSDDSE
ncbi:hypothetical protein [Endozoicomonas arenosclerae]|uniref:hypothetical protein n=1 Tax=Endozoicomonas arenosclerae TaxID=1633495 RepID=UPI000783AD78|nr:hypothetical protein [Endozoicomonas arenosclerae]